MAKRNPTSPEVICLSDDEDEQNNQRTVLRKIPSSKNINGNRNDEKNSINDWIVQRKDIVRIPELPIKRTELLKKHLEVSCSLVRFGIVEFQVESGVILLKDSEFEFKLKGGSLENLTIRLAYSDIQSFFLSYQSQPAAAFIQVRPAFADLFDQYIPSTDPLGKKFDPNSEDEKRRRIILYLKSTTPELEKANISSICCYLKNKLSSMNVFCISGPRAQELYNSSISDSVPSLLSNPRFVLDAEQLTSRTVGLNNNKIRFEISSDDLKCLNEGEFLNDNIIDFYLQYIFYEKLSEEDRERTYLFNSFFYTRLTRKGNDDISNIPAAERRYSRVKRWLRDVDLFSKDFLIVPINQTAHWFIVLIQYHNNVLTEADLISDDDDDELPKKKIHSTGEEETTKTVVENGSKNLCQPPSIVLFDSLRSGAKNRVAATLREFLQLEYDHKKTLPIGSLARKIFNIDTITSIEAAVPQQPNYFDCGLYILQYIESFFEHRSPTIDFRSPLTFSNWCETKSMGTSKRRQIFEIINRYTINKKE